MSTLWIRVLALSSLVQFCILCPNPNVRPAGAAVQPGYTLVWSDEFDEPTGQLDTSKWGHLLLANQFGKFDEGCNRTDAVSLDGQGNLVITTWTDTTATCGNPPTPHQTGMIATGDDTPISHLTPPGHKHLARYGYVEARIQFVGAASVWSSYWFQSPTYGVPINDPRKAGTEMDVIEHLYNSPDAPSALHWDAYCPNPAGKSAGSGNHSGSGPLSTGFHTYGLEWTPNVERYYYDSLLVWTVTNSPDPDPPSQITCPWTNPGTLPPSFPGPVSRANEYILLDNEVRQPLAPGTNYGLKGDARNAKMNVDYVRHYQLLAPPSNLTATAQSASQINLAWTDNTYAEDGFKVERSTDNVNFSQVASVAADTLNGTVSYLDTGLTADTRYYYRVRAYIGTNYSGYSNTANAITDVSPPAAVTNLSLPIIGKLTMAVSWTAPADDGTGESVVEYDLRRSTSLITAANFGSATRITIPNPQVSGHPECQVVTGLTACTTYYFAIKSRDEAGNWSGISNVPNATTVCVQNIFAECDPPNNDGVAPAAVTDLAVPSVGKLTMAVSWTAPGDDGTTGTATEYDFRRSTSPISAANFGSATRVIVPAPQAAGSHECRLLTGLSACTTYYFALKTRDEWGNWSGISNFPNATTVCVQNIFAECDLGGAAKQPLPNEEVPQTFSAPRPNPARGATSFRILVPSGSQGAKLRIGVFDVQGRQVRSLVNRTASPGPAQIEWNLLDDSGHRVASGLYMVRVNLGDTRKTFRLVVVR